MKETFVVCPTCGAVSVVGGPCEYCGTQLVANKDSVTYEERIIPERTISPVAFAQKVSVFKNVGEFIGNCAVVDMGGVSGMINLNGDFIFPLEFGRIKLYPTSIAYMQKGSDRYLFDLVRWKRINHELPIISSTSESWNIPDEAERKFHDDCKYYSIYLCYKTHTDSIQYYSALFDENDHLIKGFTRSHYQTVKTGLLLGDRTYFDFKTRHLYHPPQPRYYFERKGSSLVINGSILNTEGKTKEEIQNEINEAASGSSNSSSGSSNSGSDSSSLVSDISNIGCGPLLLMTVLIIIAGLLIGWMIGSLDN